MAAPVKPSPVTAARPTTPRRAVTPAAPMPEWDVADYAGDRSAPPRPSGTSIFPVSLPFEGDTEFR